MYFPADSYGFGSGSSRNNRKPLRRAKPQRSAEDNQLVALMKAMGISPERRKKVLTSENRATILNAVQEMVTVRVEEECVDVDEKENDAVDNMTSGCYNEAKALWLKDRKKRTFQKYKKTLLAFEDSMSDERRELMGVSPCPYSKKDVINFRKCLLEKYSSKTNTTRDYLQCFKSFTSYMKNYNYTAKNIFTKDIYMPKKNPPKTRTVLTDKEMYSIFENSETPLHRLSNKLMYFFALRNFEVAKVRGEHITMEDGESGERFICLRGTHAYPLLGKRDKPIDLKISYKDKEGNISEKNEHKRDIMRKAETKGYLFPGTGGRGHIEEKAILDWLKKAAIRSNIQCYKEDGEMKTVVACHLIRHTALTMYSKYLAPRDVQKFARHSNLKTTFGYLHSVDAVGRMERND